MKILEKVEGDTVVLEFYSRSGKGFIKFDGEKFILSANIVIQS